jgi:hypothetical protein
MVMLWEIELFVQQYELLCNSNILFIRQRLQYHHRLDNHCFFLWIYHVQYKYSSTLTVWSNWGLRMSG